MNKRLDVTINNRKMFTYLLVFIISFMVVVLFNRGTYSTGEENVDSLVINCPETIKIGDTLECSVELNMVTMNVQGISAKYNVTGDIEFDSFTSDNFEVYTSDQDGFVLVNVEGITGNVEVGRVTYKIPSTAIPYEEYSIELTDISLGDGDEAVLTLDNVSSKTRVLSNINTLDDITLSDGSLNEEFSKDNNEYTASVDVEKVTIDVDKTDENSIVSGDVGELDIHYGTNKFNIVVTSEDGSENTYTLSIYREYKFTSDIYIYSEDDKYIYSGTDSDSIILDNIQIDSSLNKEINNNILNISYGEELLKEYKLVRISSEMYDLNNDYIYVGTSLFDESGVIVVNALIDVSDDKLSLLVNNNIVKNIKLFSIDFNSMNVNDDIITLGGKLDYSDFINNITVSDGLIYKIFNGNEEINSGSVSDGMILKIYYNDVELDSYNISEYSLSFDDSLNIDEENKYINYIEVGTTVSGLLDKVYVTGGYAKIYKGDVEKTNTDLVGTGYIIVIYSGDTKKDEYVISVRGDSSGDGKINSIDLVQMRKHIVGWVNPNTNVIERKTGVYYYALDMNKDGKINSIDLVRMRKRIVGLDEE